MCLWQFPSLENKSPILCNHICWICMGWGLNNAIFQTWLEVTRTSSSFSLEGLLSLMQILVARFEFPDEMSWQCNQSFTHWYDLISSKESGFESKTQVRDKESNVLLSIHMPCNSLYFLRFCPTAISTRKSSLISVAREVFPFSFFLNNAFSPVSVSQI